MCLRRLPDGMSFANVFEGMATRQCAAAAATYTKSGGKPCIILQAMSCVCCVWRSFQKGDHFFANIQAMQKKHPLFPPS